MSGKNILITVGVVLVAAAVVGANLYFSRDSGLTVTTEQIKARDLEAIVSASGKIQPKRLVNITAETAGRVVNLAVNEGDRVHVGQFLLQIDPKSLRTRVDSGEASLQVAQASLEQMRQSVETARVQLEQARQNLARQQMLWKQQLTTRESLERAENDVRTAESPCRSARRAPTPQDSRIMQERATLDNAKYDLSKVRIESPIEGIVTRRNIQEGETAMIGTMNNAGTVLLTLADMSIIQAEVEVDETNIPNVQLGQTAKITIDAIPDRDVPGPRHRNRQQPDSDDVGRRCRHAGDQLQGGRRPRREGPGGPAGLHVHGGHQDGDAPGRGRRADSVSGRARADLRSERADLSRPAGAEARAAVFSAAHSSSTAAGAAQFGASAAAAKPGQTRKEMEGVFVVREKDKRVEFVPIKMGIAGDKFFEVLSGVKAGDEVVTGPYNSVRNITDGDPVKVDNRNQRNRRILEGGTARPGVL